MPKEDIKESFRQAEASLRLEGMDPSGDSLYEAIKARVIAGQITPKEGRNEIIAYYHNLNQLKAA